MFPKSTIIRTQRRRRGNIFGKGGHVSLESDIANAHGAHPENVFPPRLITTMIVVTLLQHPVLYRTTEQGKIANWTSPGPRFRQGPNFPSSLSSLSGRTTFSFCGASADLYSRRYGSSFQKRTSLLLREDPNLRRRRCCQGWTSFAGGFWEDMGGGGYFGRMLARLGGGLGGGA